MLTLSESENRFLLWKIPVCAALAVRNWMTASLWYSHAFSVSCTPCALVAATLARKNAKGNRFGHQLAFSPHYLLIIHQAS